MVLHFTHDEGGFGVTFNDITYRPPPRTSDSTLAKVEDLRINLNIDGVPITS
jgi:hypothetical protein